MHDGTRRFNTRGFIAWLMLQLVVALAITGLCLHEISEGDGQGSLIGIARHGWMSVHMAQGILLVAAAAWHLVYNWKPLWRVIRPIGGEKGRLGFELSAAAVVVAVVVIAGIFHQFVLD